MQGWDKWPAKTFEKKDIIGFLDYSQGKEDGVGNVTRTNTWAFCVQCSGCSLNVESWKRARQPE